MFQRLASALSTKVEGYQRNKQEEEAKAELKEIKHDLAPKSKPRVHRERKRADQPANARFARFASNNTSVLKGVFSLYLTEAEKAVLSQCCFSFYSAFEPDFKKQAACLKLEMQPLLQAVIDDRRDEVKKILDKNPRLASIDPKDLGITEIESKLTWQIFEPEYLLSMALKRQQLQMVKVLLPYLKNIKPTQVEKHWTLPVLDEKQRTALEVKIQDKYIEKLLLPLIRIISKDTKVRVVVKGNVYEVQHLGAETANALEDVRKKLLNDKTIKLLFLQEALNQENYYDVIQLLWAAYRAYDTHFNDLQDWNRRDLYGICVAGFILPLVHPEIGKMYCESFYDVINSGQAISAWAMQLKLVGGGLDFYRSSRSSRSGQGFEFLCSIFGRALRWGRGVAAALGCLEKLCRANASEFDRLRPRLLLATPQQSEAEQQAVMRKTS